MVMYVDVPQNNADQDVQLAYYEQMCGKVDNAVLTLLRNPGAHEDGIFIKIGNPAMAIALQHYIRKYPGMWGSRVGEFDCVVERDADNLGDPEWMEEVEDEEVV